MSPLLSPQPATSCPVLSCSSSSSSRLHLSLWLAEIEASPLLPITREAVPPFPLMLVVPSGEPAEGSTCRFSLSKSGAWKDQGMDVTSRSRIRWEQLFSPLLLVRPMKKGARSGRLLVDSCLIGNNSRTPRIRQECRRFLSSLRVAPIGGKTLVHVVFAPEKDVRSILDLVGALSSCVAFAGVAGERQTLWDGLVADPSQWWDKRSSKVQDNHPNFVHSATRDVFWVDSQHGRVDKESQSVQSRGPWRAGYGQPGLQEGADRKDARRCEVETWSNVLEHGQLSEAVGLLELLISTGSYVPDSLLYRVLKRCIARKDVVAGKRVHALAVGRGYEANTFLVNHIIRMYAFHGMLEEAKEVFSKLAAPDVFSWFFVILGHSEYGQPTEAIKLYGQMREAAVAPDNHTFVAVLKACGTVADLATGKLVHADVLGSSLKPDVFVGNCLVDMYAKCGSLVDARKVFDSLQTKDIVTWTSMIAGYAEHALGQEALALYASMQQDGKSPPDHVLFVCLLKACASIGDLDQGKQLHIQIQAKGLEADAIVGNCLVDMYAKCGGLEEARAIFERLPIKDVVTWTAMIAGYALQGLGHEALAVYAAMQQEGKTGADEFTFVCLMKACASVGAIQQGEQLHSQIRSRGLQNDVVVGNSLVDMYAKCGSLAAACGVFNRLPKKDVVTWTALMNAYALHNECHKAMQCFEEMKQQGVMPNDATFLCLIVACSHEGLVDKGRQYFKTMVEDHGVSPTVSHFTCMADLFGRAGNLQEAEDLLLSMPFEDGVAGWTSLLNACKSHGDVERGQRCFNHIIKLEPQNASAYAMLGNIYTNAGRWRDADKIESLRKSAGACKKPARAWIEVDNRVHTFNVGDERDDLSWKLKSVNLVLGDDTQKSHTELGLQPLSDTLKEDSLCGHAEKLALAYGLLNTRDGTPLLVTKNLRMCNDCHNGTKAMSRIEKREIIVRDAHRVHRFVNGFCSCGGRH